MSTKTVKSDNCGNYHTGVNVLQVQKMMQSILSRSQNIWRWVMVKVVKFVPDHGTVSSKCPLTCPQSLWLTVQSLALVPVILHQTNYGTQANQASFQSLPRHHLLCCSYCPDDSGDHQWLWESIICFPIRERTTDNCFIYICRLRKPTETSDFVAQFQVKFPEAYIHKADRA